MIQKNSSPIAVSFGEVLWDIFPTYKRIGGAPLNVVYHLRKFGIETHIITKIGDDDLGNKILKHIQDNQISSDNVQRDSTYRTGTVFATFDDHNEANYDFLENSAWDYIDLEEKTINLVKRSDVFIFGSIASRSAKSRNTLTQLIEVANYKVFDINLRPPHYDLKFVMEMMKKANLIKMNNAELEIILNELDKTFTTEEESITFIHEYFKCEEIIISKGAKGGIYSDTKSLYRFPAIEIVIRDTVGSGDAFLAGLLAEKLKSNTPITFLKKGATLGAFITSHTGACPEYEIDDFTTFYDENIYLDEEIKVSPLKEEDPS
ncbi:MULTISPECIES: carbohydrate kinase family protein [Myroides]|uniref:Carbohydrate kinase n=1 Tax=Myroides albus TaxID=2562892 RepID=A0A6I3LFW9_9FLAO|nr:MULTISPECIES: carbohydrate kinase [Myroides]MTG96704.1 carbohydrate kinase [Myroides albus]MVX34716.1 carbohydrate kinase [Myroides sp. LoEW2-1]UVD80884.1 carbohydrate kinase [Myroides albus]